jgi:hypothetical protein
VQKLWYRDNFITEALCSAASALPPSPEEGQKKTFTDFFL